MIKDFDIDVKNNHKQEIFQDDVDDDDVVDDDDDEFCRHSGAHPCWVFSYVARV